MIDTADMVLIEDNRHDIELILDSFREHNMAFKVLVLNDGARAFDYFFGPAGCIHKASIRLPKLILLDLKLPKVSGIELLKHFKSDERTKHMPIVIFTSSNECQDKLASYSLGANSYIVKPLDSDAFSRSVSQIGSYWVQMNTIVHDNN